MESFTHLNVSDIQNWNIGDTSQNSNAEKVTLDIVASSNEVRTVMRKVTLDDFIIPEYRGKNPEDYEFRHDGKIVRKDRWETGIHKIHTMLGPMPGRVVMVLSTRSYTVLTTLSSLCSLRHKVQSGSLHGLP